MFRCFAVNENAGTGRIPYNGAFIPCDQQVGASHQKKLFPYDEIEIGKMHVFVEECVGKY